MPKPSKVSANASEPTRVATHMNFPIRMDGAIVIRIERNKRNNILSPTPHKIEQALATTTSPIVIDLWEDQPDKKVDHVQRTELVQYFHVFLNFLHRWKEIRFWAPWVTPESFQGRQFLPSSLLESIEVGGPRGNNTLEVVQLLSMCWMPVDVQYEESTGPRIVPASPLQRFTIRDWKRDNKVLTIGGPLADFVPVKQLTTLVMENLMSGLDCNRILFEIADTIVNCAFPNITAFTLDQTGGSEYTLVTCSRLKSLYLGNNVTDYRKNPWGRNSFHELLHHTTAPGLLALTLCHDDRVNSEISAFIARSVCSLQALELHLVGLVPNELFNVLAQVPNLRVLKIFGDEKAKQQSFSNVVCEGLTNKDPRRFHQISPEDGDVLCPALEMLLVDERAISELPAGQIARMVESRINRSPLKFVWIAIKVNDPPRVGALNGTQITVGTTLLSQEDLWKFVDLRRDSFRWKTLKYLIIDYDRSTYSGRWNRSREWNSEAMATLTTLGPRITEAMEPTVFEYRSEVHESSFMADQQEMPTASNSNPVLTFVPVGERVTGNRDQEYGVALQQGLSEQNLAPEPNASLIWTPEDDAEIQQLWNMIFEQQSPLSNSIEGGYEPPQYPVLSEYNTSGVAGNWTLGPYEHVEQNADENDFRNIAWNTTPSDCDHVNCLCFMGMELNMHTM